MHPHPCLRPEELTGIFFPPSRDSLPPKSRQVSIALARVVSLPSPTREMFLLSTITFVRTSSAFHPFLTPSQLSWWLKARVLAKLLGGHKKLSILPTGLSLEVSWGPAQLSSLTCGVQAGSQIQNSPSMLGPVQQQRGDPPKILPAFISFGAVSFPTLFPCAWKTRELPSSCSHLLPRGCFSCKDKRETLTHQAGWMGCPCSRGAPYVSEPAFPIQCPGCPIGISAANQSRHEMSQGWLQPPLLPPCRNSVKGRNAKGFDGRSRARGSQAQAVPSSTAFVG